MTLETETHLEKKSRPGNPLFLEASILVFSSISACALAEVWARSRTDYYRTGYRPSRNSALIYELDPGHLVFSANLPISAQGTNDRLYEIKKPANTFRIVVVGDSVTFGWKVPRESAMPKVLERLLNTRTDSAYEVINLSVPGYNTAQESEVIKTKALELDPDLVVLSFCHNDVYLPLLMSPLPGVRSFVLHNSHLIHGLIQAIDLKLWEKLSHTGLAWKAWAKIKKLLFNIYYTEIPAMLQPGLERTSLVGDPPSALEDAPAIYHYMMGYDRYRIHADSILKTTDLARVPIVSIGELTDQALKAQKELGFKYILNFTPFFEARSMKSKFSSDQIHIPGDGHYTELGHELTAKILLQKLEQWRLLPNRRNTTTPNRRTHRNG